MFIVTRHRSCVSLLTVHNFYHRQLRNGLSSGAIWCGSASALSVRTPLFRWLPLLAPSALIKLYALKRLVRSLLTVGPEGLKIVSRYRCTVGRLFFQYSQQSDSVSTRPLVRSSTRLKLRISLANCYLRCHFLRPMCMRKFLVFSRSQKGLWKFKTSTRILKL